MTLGKDYDENRSGVAIRYLPEQMEFWSIKTYKTNQTKIYKMYKEYFDCTVCGARDVLCTCSQTPI